MKIEVQRHGTAWKISFSYTDFPVRQDFGTFKLYWVWHGIWIWRR